MEDNFTTYEILELPTEEIQHAHKQKKMRPKRFRYSRENLVLAIKEARERKDISIRRICQKYGVPRTTLHGKLMTGTPGL